MNRRPLLCVPVALAVIALCWSASLPAAEPKAAKPAAKVDAKAYQAMVDRAVQFLTTQGQAADGSYSSQAGIGVTGIAVAAILEQGRTPDDPAVAKSLKWLEKHVQPEGGIHVKDSLYANYETCLAMVAFNAANRDGRYTKIIKDAEKFVRGEQWDDAKGHDRSSVYFGGAGYGRKKRPDLSNTAFLVDALKTLGAGPDDPNIKAALVFVSRSQNLESDQNTTPFAVKAVPEDKGSFYYTPVGDGESFAGTTPEGGLRGYASMTYAGLKSMIYAGVKKDDPRVKAALDWISKNYDVKTNPGLGRRGLYYYYHTFAKALSAAEIDEVTDAKGVKHNWRQDLLAELKATQQSDGCWVNKEDKRWMEDDANLVTAYVLLAMKYAKP